MFFKKYYVSATAKVDLHRITVEVKRAVQEAQVKDGLVTVLVTGGTAGVTLLEEGAEVQEAFRDYLLAQVPEGTGVRPQRRSGSGRTPAHVRAALVGFQVSIPLCEGVLALSPWQEVVLLDFDDKLGRREFIIQIISESGGAAGAKKR